MERFRQLYLTDERFQKFWRKCAAMLPKRFSKDDSKMDAFKQTLLTDERFLKFWRKWEG